MDPCIVKKEEDEEEILEVDSELKIPVDAGLERLIKATCRWKYGDGSH